MVLADRPLRPEDAAVIATFPQTREELFHMFPRALWPLTPEQLLAAATGRWDATVLECEGRPVAYANFVEVEPGRYCTVGNVVVAPAARRQGVARRLIGVMAEKAWRRAVPELRISVHASNPGALTLYQTLGFRRFTSEIVPDWRGGSVELFRLSKARG